MATAPDLRRKVSQENLLLDYVRRLETRKKNRKGVMIYLSRLRPINRREHHLRLAAENFETLIKELHGQLFTLKSADMFFVYQSSVQSEVETAVQRVRYLFGDDPLVAEKADPALFSTWFNVETQYDDILRLVQGLIAEEQTAAAQKSSRVHSDTRAALRQKQQRGEPLTPEVLARVETALVRADLSNLVRRQFACSLAPNGSPLSIFSELFISIKDLRETLLPGVDLLANRWLFQHLTATLDRRMLSMLAKTDTITISGDISFNMNVSTILSPEFLSFDDNLTASRRGAMIVELQEVDIFADLGAYLFAREFIQERGYRICIDGLTHLTMAMIDRERLGADLVKMVWHGDLVEGGAEMQKRIRALVRRTGANRIVLCRCDSREAVDFGHSVGITLFQGRHVETLLAEENRKRELRQLQSRIERN
jgi:hypothetical protein